MPESVHAQGFEPHDAASNSKLNWLRAGVLGANDGIVSIAALMVGVAAATTDPAALLLTGVAGLSAGAISMALGEYVSVSSQRDSEKAWINKERRELEEFPEEELEELVALYEAQGLKPATARQVAVEMTEVDALKTHLDIELGINQEELTNPLHAAISSAIAFFAGAILPLLAVLLVPGDAKIPATVAASLIALALTGGVGAYIGGAPVPRAILRVTIGGAAALAVTYFIGSLLGSGTAI
ncbi:MAG: VIT family protein [Aurantimicrobium sp.]|jgi:VIT1/CCC1 family predicted Fe2+/Mn2+ transporter|uniref:VIT family protein n=1 Tax=Aurantimicrobium photophilum TaxID=1987356 RepID=A0A2Z3S4Z3_9MICO|nr:MULTISPECIES: VIT family protein [Aurantimicrobium]AWR22103.1 VIT family protein [Aurantimicrobium photophilum]MDF9809574.1 VIT1/CCC1 family predicted Fe2+/Mn2+ transporter [Aurantimicrobium minutum]MDH6207280.1 VIT1/CCC1 family predicted Fe2+/Mn2+ transporter [Aurantimicrobium minutum]MDH6409889.1 VIT1/CCC1 family predicted Fe2+/Mn2+ transporter [Aurantimicrobium minutum]MDH6424085.1 VIT1/CCC1 family predicted Fe2+/Mn2+ transporter [Aurantimicrobium minutum]